MKAEFNVLDQGWIPVVSEDGSRHLLGIRQTLAQAHELLEISSPSPLEEYSLYRFLGLFLMDALRPQKRSSIRALLRKGSFDMDALEAYISLCTSEGVSFDLFNGERPFLQSKYNSKTDGVEKPVSALDCTLPSGNNHTHFTHMWPAEIQPGRAAALLLTTYLFCTAMGAKKYPSGPYGAPPYFGVIKGKNLFETLVALMIPLDSIGLEFDQPPVLWRSKTEVQQFAKVGSTSWLRGALFPTRRITLVPNDSGDAVNAVYLCQGEDYENKEAWRDPYTTYRSNDTSVFPLRPHADRPIWRNYHDILDIPGEHASQMLRQYQLIHPEETVHLTLYGVETENCSYLGIHRHDFMLPLKISEPSCIELMKACIFASEQLSRSLHRALKDLTVLPGEARITTMGVYDKLCEEQFWEICRKMEEEKADRGELYQNYCSTITEYVFQTFDSTVKSLRLRASTLANVERIRSGLYKETVKLNKKEGTS